MLFGEGTGTADMVGMFVGEKQSRHILRFATDMLQPFFEDARPNADIDQDAGLFAFDINGVTFTAAGKYGKLKNGPPPFCGVAPAGTWRTVDSKRWSLSAI